MPKVKISDFSSTAGNNTDINSINIAEGCAPSGINDAIRTLMAQLKDWQSGAVAQDNTFNGVVGALAQNPVRMYDTDSSNYVALRAPGTVSSNVTWTLPGTDGTANQVLKTDGAGVLGWVTGASGDVVGPASSTDNAIARFDLTTGKLIQNSGVTIDDSNNLTIPGQADLRLADSDSSNWVAFQAPATVATNLTFTLPAADGTSGQVLQTNGSGVLSFATPAAGGGLRSVQVFTSSGTWTKPSGVTKVLVRGVGGGGGGGATRAFIIGGGASGGAGGYFEEVIDVTSVSTVSVTIGSGGAGGATEDSSGSAGGTTSFGAYCSATGGGGGSGNSSNTGGSGGTATGGNLNVTGGGGDPARNNGDNQVTSSSGGASFFGGGGKGARGNSNGTAGAAYGSGGSGGTNQSSGSSTIYSGGTGASGVVIVEEY